MTKPHSASFAMLFAGSVLLVQRLDGSWCFPGGRADSRGESPLDTALRECEEEIGVETLTLLDMLAHPPETIEGTTKKGRPHYLFVATVKQPPVILGVQEEELRDWRWVQPSAALRTMPLHHGVEWNLRVILDDPRYLTY